MTVINATPHQIDISDVHPVDCVHCDAVAPDGCGAPAWARVTLSIPPSGIVVRVGETREPAGSVAGIPLSTSVLGEPTGIEAVLPLLAAATETVVLIVSALAASAVVASPETQQQIRAALPAGCLLVITSPGPLSRDAAGQPGGCDGLTLRLELESAVYSSPALRWERCPDCWGEHGPSHDPDPCPACGGQGEIVVELESATSAVEDYEPCPDCGGRLGPDVGFGEPDACRTCGGQGRLPAGL